MHPQTTADVDEPDAIVVFKGDWNRERAFPMRSQVTAGKAFLRSRHPECTGLNRTTAQAISDGLMTDWKGRPEVIAVDRINQLPRQLQQVIFEKRAVHDFRGAFHNNSIYLMAPRLPGREALEETLLHEVIGHYGLRGMLQDQLKITLERVYFDTKQSPLSEEIKAVYFQDERFNEDLADHRQMLAEEIMARMAESAEHRKLTETQRYIATVRQGLRDMGFQLPLTNTDLSNLLHGAEQAVKNGGLVQPNPYDTCFRRAYHGSPHHFDGFSLDAVGSGEGSTAFGWGLYFASEREVAEFYRQQLTNGKTTYQGERLTNVIDDPKQAAVAAIAKVMRDRGIDAVSAQAHEVDDLNIRISALRQTRDDIVSGQGQATSPNDEMTEALDIIDSEIDLWLGRRKLTESIDPFAIGNEQGALYETTIPDDENLLDFDARFDQQSARVQEAVMSALTALGASTNEAGKPLIAFGNPTGEEVYDTLSLEVGEQQASLLLNEHGIPGLRYRNQHSRSASATPTYNFVIWDASAVTIDSVLADEAEAVAARMAQKKADRFSDWFHGSKVVDDTGNPRVLYHGTNESFDVFDAARSREGESESDALTFLSDRPDIASAFALYRSTWEGANVMPLYANAKSLLVVDGRHRPIREVENTVRMPGQRDDETVRQFARRNGHDGIHFRNVREDIGPDLVPTGDVFALFPEVSLKSATGNSGSYKAGNPDIRFDRQAPEPRDPTRSRSFMEWFDGSRVTTDDDKPLMVYHGTDHPGFSVFETQDKSLDMTPNALGENIGAFFAANANHARDFGKNVSAYFLNLKRPATFKTQQAFRDFMRQHAGRTPDLRDTEGFIVHEGQFENRMRQVLEESGYDGVIIERPEYNKTAKADKPWFIAFRPEQIKSATSNNGAFSSTNPDIRFSRTRSADTINTVNTIDTIGLRDWFGDSVITDDNDAPMMVYHGSRGGKFEVFQPSMHDETALHGVAFSPDREVAERYANAEHRQRNPEDGIKPEVYSAFIQSDRLPDAMSFFNEVEAHFKTDDYTSVPWDDVVAYARSHGIRAIDTSDIGERGEIFVIDPTAIRVVNDSDIATTTPSVSSKSELRQRSMQKRRGFHGSCYQFDQFSLAAFGKGEGAAAFGYGLYFTGKRAVAEYYRDILNDADTTSSETCGWKTHGRSEIAKELLQDLSMEQAIEFAKEREGRFRGMYDGVAQELREIRDDGKLAPNGYLYEASIPSDDHLLDWDQPLAEQPEPIRDAIRRCGILELMGNEPFRVSGPLTDGGELYSQLSLFFNDGVTLIEDPDTGRHVMPANTDGLSPEREAQALSASLLRHRGQVRHENASTYLNMLGIPGLRYLDQLSRDKAENHNHNHSHNYVIWDDSVITIEKINDQATQAVRTLTPDTTDYESPESHMADDKDLDESDTWQLASSPA